MLDLAEAALPNLPGRADLDRAAALYQDLVLEVLIAILDRYEGAPDYHWLDTKLDLLTGRDFSNAALLRGRDTVYAWIQGRGLEALAGHGFWLCESGAASRADELCARIRPVLREVAAALQAVRARNSGHLFFFMSPKGDPFSPGPDGGIAARFLGPDAPCNFSDLFCAKGLYAAARFLGDLAAAEAARAFCFMVDDAVHGGGFCSDQQPLDPKNPVVPIPGRHSHAPVMIQIGTAALLAQYEQDTAAVDFGLRQIDYILDRHVNIGGRWQQLQPLDFIEFIDDEGAPYEERGTILSDPGHALEFVGLTMKFCAAAKACRGLADAVSRRLAEIEALMPAILIRNFRNGFQAKAAGICKSFDLRARVPVNTDMPWWSLPETIRAAAFCAATTPRGTEQDSCLRVLAACHNAFVLHYVRPELHGMAIQTRAADGRPVDRVPATSDADPGYHTGLSLIDALRLLRRGVQPNPRC